MNFQITSSTTCRNVTDYVSTRKITTPWRRNTHTHSRIQNKDSLTKARTSYVVLKPTNILTPTTTIYYMVAAGMIKKRHLKA